ncbi:CPBP family intramembrane glutamic endopeptidase [Bradyrhizobium roseum]|uniref:CPBP family intramembrane glutamic endopeptidase n=1 Tax=Bradyrhizobium roseum TaxID=3056648 RepID=UPI002627660B|nr:CPBP family intramembrane glutamic endopeptidase [Bradyrhizobium roseus]WKA31059.1 CPBP family intramembrane metalloprotease [Bradyrhizobium roseus]
MDDQQQKPLLGRIGAGLSLLLFGVPALLLWLATTQLLPILVGRGWEPLLAWFASGGLVLAPLLVAALLGARMALAAPTAPAILEHLRVRPLSGEDWRLAGLVLLFTFAAVAGLQLFNANVWPGLPPHPSFMAVRPLMIGQYYILAFWLPFFVLNIVGEEFWWRGFIQPRQEPVFGRSTWLVQGLLHGLFHFSFGFGVLFLLLPVVLVIPWAVQRTRNTSVGIIIHAGVNGPGFLVVTLGLAPT